MTVAQLIEQLNKCPQDYEVFSEDEENGSYVETIVHNLHIDNERKVVILVSEEM